MQKSVDRLLAGVDTDTTNVLLTLARIWHTLETTEFATKDAAAHWAAHRIESGDVLRRAAAIYRGELAEEWHEAGASAAARELVEHIRG